ncbi:hypothetical protein HZS_2350, partial [Henneguya salminicola]
MIRKRINLPHTLPSDVATLIVPEDENFLLNDGERFIIFATPRQLNILCRSCNIYFDSTFKPVPEIFYQLFVIHGEYKNELITCVFGLMERKTEILDRRVWEKVRETVKIAYENVSRAYEAMEDHICLNSFEQQFRELI